MSDGKRVRKNVRVARWQNVALMLTLFLVFAMMVGSTMAYLKSEPTPLTNKFNEGKVDCETQETFEKNKKSSITVSNTGSVYAYVRVKLISYRVAGDDDHCIGGAAAIPDFTPGTNWVKYPTMGEGCYYYTVPLAPNAESANLLTGDGITLQKYTDADGGRQVIEVMAEAIQAEPPEAVGEAWGVTITPPEGTTQGKVEPYSNNEGGGN